MRSPALAAASQKRNAWSRSSFGGVGAGHQTPLGLRGSGVLSDSTLRARIEDVDSAARGLGWRIARPPWRSEGRADLHAVVTEHVPRHARVHLGQDHVRGGQPELCGNLRRQGGSRSLPASQTARGPCRTRFECVAPAHPRVALCGAPRQAAGRFLHVKHGAVKVRLGEVVETPVLVHARHLEVHVRTQLRRRLPTRAVSTAWPGLLQVDARGPVSALGSAPRRCVLGMGSAFWPGPKGSMSELPPPSHARVARLRATVRTG